MSSRSHNSIPTLTATLAALALVTACGAPVRRLPLPTAHGPRAATYDVEHYSLELELDPRERSLEGRCTVRLWSIGSELSQVELDLIGLRARRVTDERGRELAFRQSAQGLSIRLAEPLGSSGAREPVQLAIEYGGRPAKGLWFVDEQDGVATQVFTQGECEDARWWFPCWDAPSDRATSELRVTMPAGWVSLAAGEQVEQVVLSDGRVRDHWRMSAPHPTYLTTLVAGEFELLRDEWDGIPLVYAADPELAPWLRAGFEPTAGALEVLGELTGRRYPYAKYSQACVASFPFGGMENVSATTMTDTMLRDERGRRDYDATGLIVHEAAHQWFGDLLTCKDWSHIWLNESFATYATQLHLERTRGLDPFRIAVRDMQESYLAGDQGARRRPIVYDVYCEPMDLFEGGQTYPGGASRLHLLRFELGERAFFDGLAHYVAENAGRGVVTSDFERAMSQASGRDLSGFFRQWFRRPGFPEFRFRWEWDERREVVRASVEQTQEPLRGTPEVFSVPVDLEVATESGTRMHRLRLDARRQVFELPADGPPRWVRFDKFGWIPKRLEAHKTTREWLLLAAEDDDPNGRRDALRVLGRLAGEAEEGALRGTLVGALAGSLTRERLPALRVAAARALSGLPDAVAEAALMSAAESDREAAVRVAALDALAALGPGEPRAWLAQGEFEAGFSWATMGAAARLLAAADPVAAPAWLRERMDLDSPHDELRAALLTVLASLRGAGIEDELAGLAGDERESTSVRVAAVRALGALPVERRRPERLAALLAGTRSWHLGQALVKVLSRSREANVQRVLRAYYWNDCIDPRQKRILERAWRASRG